MTRDFRERAEQMLRATSTEVGQMSTEQICKLVHELQVHQIELQLQNEELREAQSELARQHDRYRDLYDFAPVCYLTIDAQGVIVEANLTAATTLSENRKQLLGHQLSEFLPGDSQDTWHILRRKIFSSPIDVHAELPIFAVDQSLRIFQLRSHAFGHDPGEPDRCRLALTDITEQSLARQTLRQLNIDLTKMLSDRTGELQGRIEELRLMHEAISHLAEGVLITSDQVTWPAPKIIFVNDTMCDIAGYAAQDLIGQTPRLLQGKATSRTTVRHLRRELEAGRPCVVELTNYRKDGSTYDAEVFVTPLFNEQGRRTHFVSIHRDISGRKQAEEQLRINEERFSMALRATKDAIWDLDLVRGRGWWNQSYGELFGMPADDQIWQAWADKIHPDDRDRVVRAMEAFASGEGHSDYWQAEYRFRKTDGTYAYVLDRALRSWGQAKKPIRVLGAMIDHTQRRELEKEILNISAAEHRRIGQDLHDGVGQELTGLSLVAQSLVIKLTEQGFPEVQIAQKMDAGIQRALADVRALARGLNPIDVDASGLSSALQEMTERLCQLYDVDCRFECHASIQLSDNQVAGQLYRIAQEATTNALKHSQASQIMVRLVCHGDKAVLMVQDDGIGLPEDAETTAGLGLRTMAYRASIIGSELKISKREAGGTEVKCTIPQAAIC